MQGEREVRAREAREQPVGQHRRRATEGFFGRLANHDECAAPAVAVLGHHPGRAGPGRHVEVVPAGVHHWRGRSVRAGNNDVAGEGESGFLFDWQGIQFGPQHYGRTRAVLHNRDDARSADRRRDVEAKRLRARGQLRRGLCFLECEFGVLVKVDVEAFDIQIDGIDFRWRRHRPARVVRLRRE